MPGRTFFEIRQILRMLYGGAAACPDGVADTLRELTDMRIVEVIGSVTLSRVYPTLVGARWLIGVPFSLKGLREDHPDGEDLVIYDHLGAGLGQPNRHRRGRRGGSAVPSRQEARGCVLCVPARSNRDQR